MGSSWLPSARLLPLSEAVSPQDSVKSLAQLRAAFLRRNPGRSRGHCSVQVGAFDPLRAKFHEAVRKQNSAGQVAQLKPLSIDPIVKARIIMRQNKPDLAV